jgi:hypothetical protein
MSAILIGQNSGKDEVKRTNIGKGNFLSTNSKKMTKKRLRLINETVTAIIECNFIKSHAAKRIGISPDAIQKRINNYPIIADKLKELKDDLLDQAKSRILITSPLAAAKVSDLVTTGDSQRLQLDAAIQVLDRAGIVKPSNTNLQVNVLNNLREDKQSFDL